MEREFNLKVIRIKVDGGVNILQSPTYTRLFISLLQPISWKSLTGV